ncbi:MAG: sigma 54-interacting transcriptional regulator [Desulfitobacterium sp.]|nr:sigma 54-interacting transcriptional regulator [Desulfitobacterium sp.]
MIQKNTCAPYSTTEKSGKILDFKLKFLEGVETADPRECEFISKEVAESWIRSLKRGVDPYLSPGKYYIEQEEYKKVLEKNKSLIDITKPLMKKFKEMALLPQGYIFYLCDPNGVFLLQLGQMKRVSTEGVIWNENTIGTCAHSVCINKKRPVQLIGPEHFSVKLHDIIGTAAPIMNDKEEVIGTIILGQPFVYRLEGELLDNLLSHTLGLITSLAKAIETQLKLNKSNDLLVESNHHLTNTIHELNRTMDILETTLEVIDEGVITIDKKGNILNMNREATRIFKISPEERENINIKDFLCTNTQIKDYIKAGKNADIEESIYVGNEEHSYMISIRPVKDYQTLECETAVLKLNPVEKVNAMAANRTGAVAIYTFDSIIGEDKEFRRVIELTKRFSNSKENILIIGESGTGKELFAQAIHNNYCPNGPFMAVNCAAMPRELIESELFGYEGGSFTGAERTGRPGKIELAHGGTLFLDEIGDMPLELQAVLLRALGDKQVMRIGGRRYKKVDFRLVAATNKDLFKMVKEKQYREDLYFRLSVLTVNIPPLRKRTRDVEILSHYFIKNYCLKQGWKTPEITKEALNKILEYQWPGNVRQLQNALIYAVNSAQNNVIDIDNLPDYILMDSGSINEEGLEDSGTLSLEVLEKKAIEKALLRTKNSIPDAAKILGISRSTLYRKLKTYNLEY